MREVGSGHMCEELLSSEDAECEIEQTFGLRKARRKDQNHICGSPL
jgi:hypothetical protein